MAKMKAPRGSTPDSVFWGAEPEWSPHDKSADLSGRLAKAYNWYNARASENDEKRWVLEWLKSSDPSRYAILKDLDARKYHIGYGDLGPKTLGIKIGMMCRLLSLGCPVKTDPKFMSDVELGISYLVRRALGETQREQAKTVSAEFKPSIQDRIGEQVSSLVSEVLLAQDSFLLSRTSGLVHSYGKRLGPAFPCGTCGGAGQHTKSDSPVTSDMRGLESVTHDALETKIASETVAKKKIRKVAPVKIPNLGDNPTYRHVSCATCGGTGSYASCIQDVLRKRETKSVQAFKVAEHLRNEAAAIQEVLSSKDDQITEAYSIYPKKVLKEYAAWLGQMSDDCIEFAKGVKKQRKPRRKKIKTPAEQVKRIKYQVEDPTWGIRSINPTKIIGADKLVVFNTKYKTLMIYEAADKSGLGIKGTTLINWDDKKSKCKRLRKPKDLLKIASTEGIRAIKNAYNAVRCKEKTPNGRINGSIVILQAL